MTNFGYNYTIVSWTLYSVGIFLIACRMMSRRIQLGSFRKFQLDDYLMLLVGLTFTGLTATSNIVAQTGSNYLPPGVLEKLTQTERESAIYGSKILIVMEECTLTTQWLIKACMLLLYHRFTVVLRRHVAVVALAWYCAFGFAFAQVSLLGLWCRPLKGYWTLGVKNPQCANYHNHLIVASVFNISSDGFMLFIPLPLLITSKLILRRKLVLCIVFSLGVFVILAASLNRYFAFALLYNPHFLNWYMGEAATAVYVSNIPLCWPLIRRMFSLNEFTTGPRPYIGSPPIRTPELAAANHPSNQRPKSAVTTVRSREIRELPLPPPSVSPPENRSRSRSVKPLPRKPSSPNRHSHSHSGSGARRGFEEIEDSWLDVLASPDGEVDEEKAIGWNPQSPELDLVDYRSVDMKRVNSDEML